MERKGKYDYVFKIECVKLIIKQDHPCKSVWAQKGVPETIIGKWLRFYNAYWSDGLLPKEFRIILLILNGKF